MPHLDSSTTGLTELEEELLLEEDRSLLLVILDVDGSDSSLLEETIDVSLLGVETLGDELGTLHAPNTNNGSKGNKRNAFFMLFISPYLM